MKGRNEITLCALEMHVAIQEYLDKRMTVYAPRVTSVKVDGCGDGFTIRVEEKPSAKEPKE